MLELLFQLCLWPQPMAGMGGAEVHNSPNRTMRAVCRVTTLQG